ncbi:pyruvate formate lyase-activating protein [Corynebacterium poyangense]|uniref:Pyruvate formate-lyase-activating enzyme n=1 Tax=Corynebacterium poyangense TaxID=2684405 RepID=A0A7H0SNS4_9CORY|nr:pyruvate formate-lyase-activating protein [Corynebacterium poyangense]MBZ8177747.1 pyruvate formate lyase-activating protein [Corynebacterium poyangense]QNQ90199.1 pyruvate formate lyase-activating protein [Corynebacterium poyangense]
MASDGISGVVTLDPEFGDRVRGVAQGIGSEHVQLDRAEMLAARRQGEIALVHSWEMVTAVDGPGTRMTLFLSGCPLRCQYCHNPDTMEMKTGTLERRADIVRKVLRYKRIFQVSKGGLTISGGEPLFQIEFTRKLLAEVHAAGIHTCIDTSGFLGSRLRDEDLDNIDLVLLDVKSGIPETYKKVTGRTLQPTIDFGDRLARRGLKVWVRFVLVPGLTDALDNIEAVADIVARWSDNVERVEVLPFHNMASDKWDELGLKYTLENVEPPSAEQTEATREVFRSRGITTF